MNVMSDTRSQFTDAGDSMTLLSMYALGKTRSKQHSRIGLRHWKIPRSLPLRTNLENL